MLRSALCLLVICAFVMSAAAQTRSRRGATQKKAAPAKQRATTTTTGESSALPPPPPTPAERAAQREAEKAAAAAENQVYKVDTNLVTTPVSVLDRNGRFIANLKKKDFKIFEDGVPQAITYFQSSEQPFTVVLMIDTSPSTRFKIDEIHYAAVMFVNQLRAHDQVMVVAFDQRLKVLSEPTNNKQQLFAAIYKANFGSGTSLYDAVDYVSNLNLESIPGRKAVVLFTDGVDTTSRRADYESSIAGVEEVDALFYPIRYDTQRRGDAGAVASAYGMQLPPGMVVQLGRGQSSREYQRGKSYLEALAANSGGRIFEADENTDLEASFAGVAEELRRQYSIGYYGSEDAKPGDRKRIKIQVTRPAQAVVKAKSTYIVKDRTEQPAEGPAAPRLQSK
ncbi:MAG TPA: VWA domain-containing protein [Pyrinomonadaceae bacterium]